MTTTNTETSAKPIETVAEMLARIEALATPAAAVVPEGCAAMDDGVFAAYATDQVEKAGADADAGAARLAHLRSNIAIVKEAVAASKPAVITLFVEAAPPAEEPKAPLAIEVAKRMAALSIELGKEAKDGNDLAVNVAKSMRISVAKAGEASVLLAKVAAMFGVDIADPEMRDYKLRWAVSDAVEALQEAAKLEATLTTLSATLGVTTTDAMKADTIAKSASGADVWPRDMNATTVKGGVHVENPLSWGANGGS